MENEMWMARDCFFFSLSSIFYRLFSMQFIRLIVPYAHIIRKKKKKRTVFFFFRKVKLAYYASEAREMEFGHSIWRHSFRSILIIKIVLSMNKRDETMPTINWIYAPVLKKHQHSANAKSKLNSIIIRDWKRRGNERRWAADHIQLREERVNSYRAQVSRRTIVVRSKTNQNHNQMK